MGLVRVLCLIGVLEFVTMGLMSFLQIPEGFSKNLLDSIILVGLSAPVLYFADLRRRQAENRRQASETQLKSILDNASEGLIALNAFQRILLFNQSAERMYGYRAEEVLGQPLALLIPEPSRDRHREQVERFAQTPEGSRPMGMRQTLLGRRKDGTEFPAQVGISKFTIGRDTYLIAVVADATERRQAEQALRESEDRYRDLVEHNRDLMCTHDLNGQILTANASAANLLGYDVKTLLGMTIRDLLAPKVRHHYEDYITNLRRDGVASGLMRVRTRTGERRLWEYHNTLRTEGVATPIVRGMAHDITERFKAEEEIRQRAGEFAALYETSRVLSQQLELPTLLETIIEHATSLLDADSCFIYLYDPQENNLQLVLEKGLNARRGSRLELGEGLSGKVAQTRQAKWVDQYHTWYERSTKFEGLLIGSVVGVPMLCGGELIGVLTVTGLMSNPRRFKEADARLLSLFAGQAASAVRVTRLLREKQRRLTELEIVNKVSISLRSVQTVDEIPPRLLDEALAALDADAGIIWLYEPARGEMRVGSARGWISDVVPFPLHPPEGIAGHVFNTGEAYAAREFANDAHVPESIRVKVPAGWGGVCVPVRAAQATVGVLLVSIRLPREIQPEEVKLLATLAEIAGNTIHRMRLHEQTVRSVQHLTALQSIDTAIASTLDLRVTLRVILEHVTTELQVDASDILLLNPHLHTLDYAASRGFHSSAIERSHLRLGEGVAGRAALERRLCWIPNLAEARGTFARADLIIAEGFVSYYAVPLIAKGQVRGVLDVFHRSPLDPDPEWLSFLNNLAAQAAIAIDNASLFEGLQQSNAELALAYEQTLEGWVKALDMRDKETEGHTQRVTDMTCRMAAAIGMGNQEQLQVRRGALLHDIGNIGIPDSILLKPGPLTEEEWTIMRKHPVYARELLSPIAYLRSAIDIPHSHHEKWDGTGYPHGLKGEQIPLAARLFAIVDVWDTLGSDRPQRKAWPADQILEYIRQQAGIHFDPKLVPVFVELLDIQRQVMPAEYVL